MIDIEDKVYYFRTYDNSSIRKLDLNTINSDTTTYSVTPIYCVKATYAEVAIK